MLLVLLSFSLLSSCISKRDQFLSEYPEIQPLANKCLSKADFDSCYNVGMFAMKRENRTISKSFFSISCESNHADSCFELGNLTNNENQKVNYFHQSCVYGSWQSCQWLSSYYAKMGNRIHEVKYNYVGCMLRFNKDTCGAKPVGL